VNLTKIPSFIKRFKSVKVLDISYNKLTELNHYIIYMYGLEKIDMRYNELNELPDFLWKYIAKLNEIIIDSHLYPYPPNDNIKLNHTFFGIRKKINIASKNKIPMVDDEIKEILRVYRVLLRENIISIIKYNVMILLLNFKYNWLNTYHKYFISLKIKL